MRNIIAAGHEATVWNRSPELAEALKTEGARIASAMRRNAVHILCSTISTELARRLTSEHCGRRHAVDRTMPAAARRHRPLLDAIGRQTTVVDTEPWQANLV